LQNLKHPVLLVMDTFEKAETAVKLWVTGPLLARIARLPSLRIVLAGQEVPDADSIEWGDYCHPVVEALGKIIPVRDPESWLAGVCHAHKGRPLEIMQSIQSLPTRRENG
jgi:hypothetical protein